VIKRALGRPLKFHDLEFGRRLSSLSIFHPRKRYSLLYPMETVKPLENVLCMKGGSGDSSYAYNSPSVQVIPSLDFYGFFSFKRMIQLIHLYPFHCNEAQLKMLEALKPILEHGISQNLRTIMNTGAAVFRIADLGCATGMNTFLAADTIVTAIKSTFTRHSMDVPEFQLYFGDLPSNDFNTLLRTLPPFLAGDMTSGDAKAVTAAAHGERKPPARRFYFAAEVSGSHYGRLFPRQSLHFCHSSVSLHWLSQVSEITFDFDPVHYISKYSKNLYNNFFRFT